jgi:acetyl esterase/lipase
VECAASLFDRIETNGISWDAPITMSPRTFQDMTSEDILTSSSAPADARIAYGSDPNQFLDLRQPPGNKRSTPYPLVVNVHGGFWRARYNLDHASHLCAALTSLGFATANVEYRRVGNEGGGWPGTFADIRSAYAFLIENAGAHNLDMHRMLVLGHSAGAQLALCLAAHEPGLTRVISLAGVVDLQRAYELHLSHDAVVELLHGTPSQVPDFYRQADPMRLSIAHARRVLIHGSADDQVPVEFSQAYVTAKRKYYEKQKKDVLLLEIPGAGHFDLIDPRSRAWKQVEQSVLKLLK